MDQYKNVVWQKLFTKGSAEQIKFVQVQIDCFKTYDTPIYNMKMLQFQLKVALAMNLYLSYLIIVERNNIEDFFFNQSYLGTTWFTIICLQNLVIVLPKVIMMIMLYIVIDCSKNIDALIVNVEDFMKTKIYYYNCYISKYIWINYGVGFLIWAINIFYGYNPESERIVYLCHHVLYLMVARLILFIVKIFYQKKGLSKDQLEKLIDTKQFEVEEEFTKKHEDCCSVCLEDYSIGDKSLRLDCTHIYHLKCIKTWLLEQNKCPCCNQFAFREL